MTGTAPLLRPNDSADQISENIGDVLASIRRLIAQDETEEPASVASSPDSDAETPAQPPNAPGPAALEDTRTLILSPEFLVAPGASGVAGRGALSPASALPVEGSATPVQALYPAQWAREHGDGEDSHDASLRGADNAPSRAAAEGSVNGGTVEAFPARAEAASPAVPVPAASLPRPVPAGGFHPPALAAPQAEGLSVGPHPIAPPQNLLAGGPLLRSLLRDIVRQEIRGELDSHLEQKLRQMIREEIARTLTEALELPA